MVSDKRMNTVHVFVHIGVRHRLSFSDRRGQTAGAAAARPCCKRTSVACLARGSAKGSAR
ncbi:hypothetical protein SBBP1_1020005 [Burkholderiales bacterium]|nr:hypothetical protein SBBP1_1020005 [Burkholderiales bacterium]